jgi:hypothetical protein
VGWHRVFNAVGVAGILGSYSFFRSNAECIDKLPGCNLTSAAAQTMLISCMTSFLMLGFKIATAHKMHVKMGDLANYGALYDKVVAALGADEAQRLVQADGNAAAASGGQGAAQAAIPAAIPPVVGHAVGEAGHDGADAHPAVNPAPMGFLVRPIVPILVAASLEGMQHEEQQEESGEVVEVRGVCPGCKQNVLSSDEGRKREGTVYFHLGCIKGMCPRCNKIVHADAERVNVAGKYWHRECAANSAGPSGSAH